MRQKILYATFFFYSLFLLLKPALPQIRFSDPIIIFLKQSDANEFQSVFAADLDNDGDMDVLSASIWDIAWHENTDGFGSFGNQQVITTAVDWAYSVYAADLDGDGDIDVLSASDYDNKIAWYENTDGFGSFGNQQVITTAAGGARSVYAADLDGDSDLDVLSASFDDDKIAWYENTDGKGTYGNQQVISTAANGPLSVYAADLDGDHDMDVLSASGYDDKIAWYENTDGFGSFGNQQVITTAAAVAVSVYAADLDGDGDIDVLSSSSIDGKIAWYENTDGRGGFGNQQVITIAANGAWSVYAADLGGDSDLDVLSASGNDKIAWYENSDGFGSFGNQQVITTTAYGAYSVYTADLNGDGDMDVLSASHLDNKIAWYENLGFQPEAPLPISPENGTYLNNNTPKLVWLVPTDADGDSLHFKVEIAADSSFTTHIPGSPFESQVSTIGFDPMPPVPHGVDSCSYNLKNSLSDGIYYWRVSAWDGRSYGAASTPWKFTVDTSKPYTSNHSPAKDATDVALNSNIVVHVQDDLSEVKQSSIAMKVNGSTVIPVITGSASDYTLTYNPVTDFDYNQTVTVTINAEDNAGNQMDTDSYSFSTVADSTAPYTSNHNPAKDAQNVSLDTNIEVHVQDSVSGVKQSSIVMKVNGSQVSPVITGSDSDFTVTYDPANDFSYNQTINVTIDAEDNAGNRMTPDSYSFSTVSDSVPPYTSEHNPAPGATDVATNTNIVLHVKDAISGVKKSSIILTVKGNSVTPVITGTPTDYTVTYDPVTDFEKEDTVRVSISAEDLAGNIMDMDSYSFITAGSGNVAPAAPALSSPGDGSYTNAIKPYLTWLVPTDPNNDSLHFKVEIATSDDFTNPVNGSPFISQQNTEGFNPKPPVVAGSDSCSYSLQSALNADGIYYWRVSARDDFDYGSPSNIWRFIIDSTPPAGATAVSVDTSRNLSFTVAWGFSATDGPGAGISGHYDVNVKNESGTWRNWLSHFLGDSAVFTGVHGETYYFEAAAWDKVGNREQFSGNAETATVIDTSTWHPTPDFALLIEPYSAEIFAGDAISIRVSLIPENGFNEIVTLTTNGLPAHTEPNFNPVAIDTTSASLLKIQTSVTTPPGNYQVNIIGTTGTLTRVQSFKLIIRAVPDFQLLVTSEAQPIKAGETATYEVTLQPLHGFDQTVTLSISNLPAAITSDFSQPSIDIHSSSYLFVNTELTAATGQYTLVITGTVSPEFYRTAEIVLEIEGFQAGATPNPFTPNEDGFNDFVMFNYPELREGSGSIQIFNFRGKLVNEIKDDYRWYGKNDQGEPLPPGVYIFVVKVNGKMIAKGPITLIR